MEVMSRLTTSPMTGYQDDNIPMEVIQTMESSYNPIPL